MSESGRWLKRFLAFSIFLNFALLLYVGYLIVDNGISVTYMGVAIEDAQKQAATLAALFEVYASDMTSTELETMADALGLEYFVKSALAPESETWVIGIVPFEFENGRLVRIETYP